MKPKQIREVVKLIREHFRLQAEVRMLALILENSVTIMRPPVGWQELLQRGRLTPEYRSISEQSAQLLAHVEQAPDETELDELFGTIPPTDFLN
jgi:hypothetical protein